MKTPRADDFYVDPKAAPRLKTPMDDLPRIVSPAQRGLDAQTLGHPGAQVPGRPDLKVPRPLGTQAPRPRDPKASEPATANAYNLLEKADERQTLRLTEREFRRLNRLQDQLGTVLDVRKVDKNDILRCGLQRIFEEYERDGERSELIARLRKKYR